MAHPLSKHFLKVCIWKKSPKFPASFISELLSLLGEKDFKDKSFIFEGHFVKAYQMCMGKVPLL